jgi:hypothetical protein
MTIRIWLAAGLLSLSAGAVGAGSADDDLSIVRKAVAQSATPSPAASPTRAEREEAPAPKDKAVLRWLKVRVQERTGKRISINLPLSLARAVSDLPFDFDCGHHRCKLSVGDILRSFDTGQELVQVDKEDATVRVWVE